MSRILKLFGVRRHGHTPIEDKYYNERDTAKKESVRLTALFNTAFVVCPGPDHKRYSTMLAEIEREQLRKEKT